MKNDMQYNTNLVEILIENASIYKNKTYVRYLVNGEDDERLLNFEQLFFKSSTLTAVLQQTIPQGARIILIFNNVFDFIIAFWACVLGGFVAVPVNPPRDEKSTARLFTLAEDAKAMCIISSANYTDKIYTYNSKHRVFNPECIFNFEQITNDTSSYTYQIPPIHPENPVFLQYTSGSTGMPKGVIIHHKNVLQNIKMLEHTFSANGTLDIKNEHLVSWLPYYHDMGLIGCIIFPAISAFTVTLMSPLMFLQKPLRWLKAISTYQATMSYAPNFGYNLCVNKIKDNDLNALDLSHWAIALNGAEVVRAETLNKFYKKFSATGFREEAFYAAYGMAEATLFLTGSDRLCIPHRIHVDKDDLFFNNRITLSENHAAQTLVSCGKPGLELNLCIIHPETLTEMADNQVGEICVSGKNITSGYWQREVLNKEIFITIHGKRYLKTGDLGFRNNSEIYVTGRIKDLIVLRGRNLYPQDLEESTEECHELIKKGTVVAFSIDHAESEHAVIMVELSSNISTKIQQDIKRTIFARLMHDYGIEAIIAFVKKGSILKTSSGKLQRSQCKNLYSSKQVSFIE